MSMANNKLWIGDFLTPYSILSICSASADSILAVAFPVTSFATWMHTNISFISRTCLYATWVVEFTVFFRKIFLEQPTVKVCSVRSASSASTFCTLLLNSPGWLSPVLCIQSHAPRVQSFQRFRVINLTFRIECLCLYVNRWSTTRYKLQRLHFQSEMRRNNWKASGLCVS